MLITFDDIEKPFKGRYAKSYELAFTESAATLNESQEKKYSKNYHFDVFLSHSYNRGLNKTQILKLKAHLESEFVLDIYVDWLVDTQLPRDKVDADTARTLRNRMDHSKCLFFATSETSQNSRWMPWELGYMDGLNGLVAILPLTARLTDSYKGQEYLGIYPYIDAHPREGSRTDILWVNLNRNTYVPYLNWLTGDQPYKH